MGTTSGSLEVGRPPHRASVQEWTWVYCAKAMCIQIGATSKRPRRSKQSDYPARLGVKPNLPESGTSAEPWHGLHVAKQRV